MTPPLAIDIDGTMTRPDGGIDPRLFDPLREWDAPVVLATGKAFPYPVALCEFVGIPERVVAENGGVVLADGHLHVEGDRDAAERVTAALREEGYAGSGWGEPDMHNRWRETELSVSTTVPSERLEQIAAEHDQVVVNTGYAAHVKSPSVSKATGLRRVAEVMDRPPSSFVAVGDSANDAEMFELVDTAVAVANADEHATARADVVTDGAYGSGVLEALERVG